MYIKNYFASNRILMPDRKIKNISNLPNPLSVQVRNPEGGKDIIVLLGSNEEFWSPNNLDTNSTTIYTRKGLIALYEENKPKGANYFETYPADYWLSKQERPEIDEADTNEDVQEQEIVSTQRMKWEDADLAFLKKNYPKKGVSYCAEKLGRTKHSVKKKVEALGLKKSDVKE
jgi:hypothetical protein